MIKMNLDNGNFTEFEVNGDAATVSAELCVLIHKIADEYIVEKKDIMNSVHLMYVFEDILSEKGFKMVFDDILPPSKFGKTFEKQEEEDAED